MKHSILRSIVSVSLMLAITLVTVPLSASDLPGGSRMIGSVGTTGPVELRGVSISGGGTLFSGDRIQVHPKGYAKVLVGAGKIELFENADVNIQKDATEIKIAMNGGMVGFTASTPVRVNLASFEVTGKDNASANVAMMSSTTAGVRALSGDVTVRNLKTSESYRVKKGQERLLLLKDSVSTPSMGDMASAVPGSVPAPSLPSSKPAPAPARRGLSMDTGGWLALIGAGVGGGIAIAGLVIAQNNKDDIKDLGKKIDTLTAANTASNAALAAQLTLISNLSAIANTNAQLQSQTASTQALAGQAQLALANVNATDAAAAAKISLDASASQTRLNALASQVSILQAQLAKGGGSQSQLNALLQQEENERAISNKLAADLNALLLKNKNVNGVPQGSVGTVGPPTQASASVPV